MLIVGFECLLTAGEDNMALATLHQLIKKVQVASQLSKDET
jgi:hypothetical protein